MSLLIMCDGCSQIGDPGTVGTAYAARMALRKRGWLTGPVDVCPDCQERRRQEREAIAAAAKAATS